MRTKNLISPIALIVFFFFIGGPVGEGIRVQFVFDGDTISLENGETVRYIGIDAPEIDHDTNRGEYMAYAARELNRKLLIDAPVTVQRGMQGRDRYGRLLGFVFLLDDQMVNALLVAEGLAMVSTRPPNTRYRSRLLHAQRQAMEARAGIWRRLPEKDGRGYVGNRHSYRFHTRDCPFGRRISRANRVSLDSLQDAFWQGYSPCKACNPAAVLKRVELGRGRAN